MQIMLSALASRTHGGQARSVTDAVRQSRKNPGTRLYCRFLPFLR